jgi:hypothetical protein
MLCEQQRMHLLQEHEDRESAGTVAVSPENATGMWRRQGLTASRGLLLTSKKITLLWQSTWDVTCILQYHDVCARPQDWVVSAR